MPISDINRAVNERLEPYKLTEMERQMAKIADEAETSRHDDSLKRLPADLTQIIEAEHHIENSGDHDQLKRDKNKLESRLKSVNRRKVTRELFNGDRTVDSLDLGGAQIDLDVLQRLVTELSNDSSLAPSELDTVDAKDIEAQITEIENQLKQLKDANDRFENLSVDDSQVENEINERSIFKARVEKLKVAFGPRFKILNQKQAELNAKQAKLQEEIDTAIANQVGEVDSQISELGSQIGKANNLIEYYEKIVAANPDIAKANEKDRTADTKFKERFSASYPLAKRFVEMAEAKIKELDKSKKKPTLSKEFEQQVEQIERRSNELKSELDQIAEQIKEFFPNTSSLSNPAYVEFEEKLISLTKIIQSENNGVEEKELATLAKRDVEKMKNESPGFYETFLTINPLHKIILEGESYDPEIRQMSKHQLEQAYNGHPTKNVGIFEYWFEGAKGSTVALQTGQIMGEIGRMGFECKKTSSDIEVNLPGLEGTKVYLPIEDLTADRKSFLQTLSTLKNMGGQI